MTREGPPLDQLTRRLSESPAEILAEPRLGATGAIHVDAVVHDLMLDLGGQPPSPESLPLFQAPDKSRRNDLRLALIACWLLHDPWFRRQQRLAPQALEWLTGGLADLARLVDPSLFVSDPDRREELVRLCLAALDLRPAGETDVQARDRLTTLDTVERAQIIRDTQEKQKRARQLREEMRRKEAQEAAAKATRE